MFTSIGRFTFQTYTLYISLAIVCCAGIAAYRLNRHASYRAIADVVVAMVILGFIGARLEYVLLNTDIFASDWTQSFTMQIGGLDWHGALMGGVFGLIMVARLHQLDIVQTVEAFMPTVPLIAFAGWTACRQVGCAYGTEVETLAFYPAWMVTEGRDIFGIIAPRYDTYSFGQWLAWSLWVLIAVLWLRNPFPNQHGRRFPLIILLFCMGMFIIGQVRGDHAAVMWRFRSDQWLDAIIFLLAAIQFVRTKSHPQN